MSIDHPIHSFYFISFMAYAIHWCRVEAERYFDTEIGWLFSAVLSCMYGAVVSSEASVLSHCNKI